MKNKFNKKNLFCLITVLSTFLSYASLARGPSLEQLWNQESELDRPWPEISSDQLLHELSKTHVIFVKGFLNEGIFGYFKDNREVLENEFHATTSSEPPSSFHSIGDNVEEFVKKIREISQAKKKPIMLIGHSKGGAEVLYLALKHPELILNGTVSRAILIQPAIGGSPVAKFLNNQTIIGLLPNSIKAGLISLLPEDAHKQFKNALKNLKQRVSAEEFDFISKRIFYVRSFQDTTQVVYELVPTNLILKSAGQRIYHDDRNDGLLLVKDQMLDGIGIDLGILHADHADLTVRGFQSNSSSNERMSFTRALMAKVFEKPLPPLALAHTKNPLPLIRPLKTLDNIKHFLNHNLNLQAQMFKSFYDLKYGEYLSLLASSCVESRKVTQLKAGPESTNSLVPCLVKKLANKMLNDYFPPELPTHQWQMTIDQRMSLVLAGLDALKLFLKNTENINLSSGKMATTLIGLIDSLWFERRAISEEQFLILDEADPSALYLLQDLKNKFWKLADQWAKN